MAEIGSAVVVVAPRPEQQRQGRVRIHVIGEGQQQRRAGDAADARQNAERQPHAHAGEQVHQPMRIENDQQGVPAA